MFATSLVSLGRAMWLLLASSMVACSLTKPLTRSALRQQIDYVNRPGTESPSLERVAPGIWTYQHYFDRTLVIETDEGLVVVDPFSADLVEHLRAALHEAGVGDRFRTLIYTHYHLDHTRGGAALEPTEVICHVRCQHWWDRFDDESVAEVVLPTRTVDGDASLTIGGRRIELLHLANAHTDTMYAVLLPEERVLYAADTVAIRALLPTGGVSLFVPDYLRALDRLEGLDFDVFVSSHFAWGTKDDFREAAQLQRDSWRWIGESLERTPATPGLPLINDRRRVDRAYAWYFDRMEERYGDWHGFDSQILPTFLNGFVVRYVGS